MFIADTDVRVEYRVSAMKRPTRKQTPADVLAGIVREISRRRSFVLLSHEEPDGDAIGCQVALALALRELGKEAEAFRVDPVPPFLEFLNAAHPIEEYRPERDRERILGADALIFLDSSDFFRLGDLAETARASTALKINIDHHRDNAFFADINFVRFTAGGTAQLIFELIRALQVPIRGTIAEAIYTGLSTDTVNFRYIDPEGEMIGIVAELARGGIDIDGLQEKIYLSRPETYLEDISALFRLVRYENGGALAWFAMPGNSHLSFYERDVASEALKQLLSVKRIRAALMIHGEKEGTEVWLRSKTDVDVGTAALKIGGGGHRTASGAFLKGTSIGEAIPLVLKTVLAEMRQATLPLPEGTGRTGTGSR
jgi:phosphoesterase RecJ-like protein